MKIIKVAALIVPVVVAIATLPANAKQQQAIRYQCDGGKTFEAEFLPESAQLKLDEDRMLTLRQIPSASGAQYSDDRTTLFTKGNEAFVEVENNVVLNRCVAQETTNSRRIRALW